MRNAIRDESFEKRHSRRQKKRRRAQLIRRFISFGLLGVILLCIILFFTPILNIRNVSITGNSKIDTAQIEQSLGMVVGENLLLTRTNKIEDAILSFPYAETVTVKRKLIPPSIIIEIVECEPIAYIIHNKTFVIVNVNGKILEVTDQKPELMELTGLKLTSSNAGEIISLDDNGKLKSVLDVLATFRKSGLMDGVTVINFEDMDNLTFNYQNRIDGICGSTSDLSHKLSLFREAITSNRLTENSRGTIDLTQTGYARYRP